MQITKETLDAKLAELAQAEAQAKANLNAIEGARIMLAQLRDVLESAGQSPATDAPVGN